MLFCITGFSQELPIASPKCTIEQRIGLTDTRLIYSRPSVRNREIFGSLIPNGTHWRLGANERTTFESASMFFINDQKFEEGIYSLSVMCDENEWTLILNRDIEGWGVSNHNPSLDVARISVPVTHELFTETMSITWDSITESTAKLNMCWEKTCASYKFSFPTEKLALQNIKVELGRENAPWTSWRNAARYALSKDLKQGPEWAAKALELKPDDWYVNFLNAQYASKSNQNKEAKRLAKRAMDLGKAESSSKGVKFEYEATIEAFIKDLK